MLDGLRLALTTLTIAPVRAPQRIDRRTAGAAMALAPLVGLGLGLVAAAVLLAARMAGAPLLGCALAVATLAVLTRGLHLDGLADTADGLGSYLPAEAARRIMKQPDVGALGLAAVVLVLLVQVTALLACVEHGRGTASLVLAVVTGRLAVTFACTRTTPAAAPEGLGALVAGTVPSRTPLLLAAATLLAAAGWQAADEHAGWTGSARAVLAIVAGLLAAGLLRRHAIRRFGGITGDVLGAGVEVATCVTLAVLALGR